MAAVQTVQAALSRENKKPKNTYVLKFVFLIFWCPRLRSHQATETMIIAEKYSIFIGFASPEACRNYDYSREVFDLLLGLYPKKHAETMSIDEKKCRTMENQGRLSYNSQEPSRDREFVRLFVRRLLVRACVWQAVQVCRTGCRWRRETYL